MLKTLLFLVLAALAAVLLFAATRPDSFAIQRSARIQAPPERLFGLINDMRAFNTWNPYNRKDPNIQGSYRGPASGPGAAYDFQGNKDVGRGSIAIDSAAAPTRVTMKLDMVEPFEGHNNIVFSITPQGGSSEVVWAMNGPSPYIAKVAGLFFNMDKMIGKDFEAGLASLKALAEKP